MPGHVAEAVGSNVELYAALFVLDYHLRHFGSFLFGDDRAGQPLDYGSGRLVHLFPGLDGMVPQHAGLN
ncbi:hypothetical protein D3C86_2009450 [compost metagenome]